MTLVVVGGLRILLNERERDRVRKPTLLNLECIFSILIIINFQEPATICVKC